MDHSLNPHPLFFEALEKEIEQQNGDTFSGGFNDALGVQSRMFPASLPVIPLLDQAHDQRAGREVTGDYFDCFEMPDRNLGLAIGEVSSKGMSAALMTPVLHSLVRGIGMAKDQPLTEMVRKIGETFSRLCPEGCLATLFIAAIDAARGHLRYVNAGHEPPLVLRSRAHRKRTLLLEATGPVLGLLRRRRYHERVCMLAPGDVLVAMTDGVCDAESTVGQVWGRDRLLRVIQKCDDLPARAMVNEIFEELDRTTEGTARQDDMTLWLGRLKREEQKPLIMGEEVDQEARPQKQSASLALAAA